MNEVVQAVTSVVGLFADDPDQVTRVVGVAVMVLGVLRALVVPLRRFAEASEAKWDNRAVEVVARVLGGIDDANPVRMPKVRVKK